MSLNPTDLQPISFKPVIDSDSLLLQIAACLHIARILQLILIRKPCDSLIIATTSVRQNLRNEPNARIVCQCRPTNVNTLTFTERSNQSVQCHAKVNFHYSLLHMTTSTTEIVQSFLQVTCLFSHASWVALHIHQPRQQTRRVQCPSKFLQWFYSDSFPTVTYTGLSTIHNIYRLVDCNPRDPLNSIGSMPKPSLITPANAY